MYCAGKVLSKHIWLCWDNRDWHCCAGSSFAVPWPSLSPTISAGVQCFLGDLCPYRVTSQVSTGRQADKHTWHPGLDFKINGEKWCGFFYYCFFHQGSEDVTLDFWKLFFCLLYAFGGTFLRIPFYFVFYQVGRERVLELQSIVNTIFLFPVNGESRLIPNTDFCFIPSCPSHLSLKKKANPKPK